MGNLGSTQLIISQPNKVINNKIPKQKYIEWNFRRLFPLFKDRKQQSKRYPISLITPKKNNRCIGVNLRKNPKNFCLTFWIQIKKVGLVSRFFFENILEGEVLYFRH